MFLGENHSIYIGRAAPWSFELTNNKDSPQLATNPGGFRSAKNFAVVNLKVGLGKLMLDYLHHTCNSYFIQITRLRTHADPAARQLLLCNQSTPSTLQGSTFPNQSLQVELAKDWNHFPWESPYMSSCSCCNFVHMVAILEGWNH